MEFLKRSMASSDAYFVQSKIPNWTEWRVDNAVKEGYKVNPWVFRAIQLITQNASSVPWVVFDEKMSPIWNHPISKLLARPNPYFSRQKLMELMISWLELSGNAYLKVVFVNGKPAELWPISPDRISPIPSSDPGKFIEGYKIIDDGGAERIDPEYNENTIIHIKLFDPSNPYLGIAPLQAASKSVDLDNAQLEWNTSTMQNRGVVDGVFTFKRPIDGQQAQSIVDRLIDKFSGKKNARKPLVIGDDATYTRLSLNPIELDFQNSRKHNREEILSVFGVPPQLIGIQDSSTYNNYALSMRIFWETTVLPLLDMIKDSFNHFFDMRDGTIIHYDVSEVASLRGNEEEKAKIAKTYYEIGVPVSITNEKLALGLPAYEGWDVVSRVIMPDEAGAAQLQPMKDAEAKDPKLTDNSEEQKQLIRSLTILKAKIENEENFEESLREFRKSSDLPVVTKIADLIKDQIHYGVASGMTNAQIKRAIFDTGVFK